MESDDVPGAWTLPSLWTHRTRPQRLGKPHSTRFPTAPTRTIGFTEKKEQNPDVHPTPHTKFLTLPIRYARQVSVPAHYKGRSLGDYTIDLIVEDLVVIEVKSVAHVLPVFEAQLITYLRLTRKRLGLLINFNTQLLKNGIIRRAL